MDHYGVYLRVHPGASLAAEDTPRGSLLPLACVLCLLIITTPLLPEYVRTVWNIQQHAGSPTHKRSNNSKQCVGTYNAVVYAISVRRFL